MSEARAPANYWGIILGAGSLIVSIIGMMIAANKSDADRTRILEQRLCRLEARASVGECGT